MPSIRVCHVILRDPLRYSRGTTIQPLANRWQIRSLNSRFRKDNPHGQTGMHVPCIYRAMVQFNRALCDGKAQASAAAAGLACGVGLEKRLENVREKSLLNSGPLIEDRDGHTISLVCERQIDLLSSRRVADGITNHILNGALQ